MLPLSLMDLQARSIVPSANVYVGLGSNLGFGDFSSRELLQLAIRKLGAGGDEVVATSGYWVSNAWPAHAGTPNFVNAVCRIRPHDSEPVQLLQRLHQIEAELGRQRDQQDRWAARSLDLDLLDYNGLILENCSFLTLPHARLSDRDFVLHPLLQVAPDWHHPITGLNARQLLADTLQQGRSNNCRLLEE